ncbi:MAG: hypothetical protein WCP28_08605 [Actinomycetes bacterium]
MRTAVVVLARDTETAAEVSAGSRERPYSEVVIKKGAYAHPTC